VIRAGKQGSPETQTFTQIPITGFKDCSRTIAYSQLGQDAGHVVLHRPLKDSNGIRDLAIAVAGHHPSQDFGLALRKRVRRIRAGKVRPRLLQPSQHSFGNGGFDPCSPGFERADSLSELLQCYVFQQKATRASSNSFKEQVVIV
jgi:hypothetical protein